MKSRGSCLNVYALSLLAFLFSFGNAPARPQSAQSGGDSSKTDANAAKKSTEKTTKDEKKTAPAAAAPAGPATGAPNTNSAATKKLAPPPNTSGMVWVNTGSRVYHKPGTRWYGKTKHGKYMTEADAIKAGYHAAAKE
jgi:cytoskeletal protein RodZ